MAVTTKIVRRAIRRKALWQGIFGPSRLWRAVALWVFGKATIKRFFGKKQEILDVSKLGVGRFLSVQTDKPLTRRGARKLAKAGKPVPTKADYEAAAWAVVRSRQAS